MKIKTNDKVKIVRGKDSGKEGKVIQVFANENKVVVEGANIMKKHVRSRKGGDKGQTIELAAPLRVENVMMLCPRCNRAARVGYKMDGDRKKRACHKCHEFID
ncbi:50S ribosomal protein L24 [Patescibacteria group bacterium]|nr:50S ribosomal protein L24 [Patescibacteria group bacterium]